MQYDGIMWVNNVVFYKNYEYLKIRKIKKNDKIIKEKGRLPKIISFILISI